MAPSPFYRLVTDLEQSWIPIWLPKTPKSLLLLLIIILYLYYYFKKGYYLKMPTFFGKMPLPLKFKKPWPYNTFF